MRDHILESIFLDPGLWDEVIAHGIEKHIPRDILERLADPHERAELCINIGEGEYGIRPPHTGYRLKDDGSERLFLINDPLDRMLLNVIYKWLMRHTSDMIHPACRSYQSGIGIGQVVKDISAEISCLSGRDADAIVGRKFDIHKYFDSVKREHIHRALSEVERRYGRSSVMDLLHHYYDSDTYYDSRRRVYDENYFGIKQGSAVSAWLANVLLFGLDEEMSARGGLYVRYSDDILYIGADYEAATEVMRGYLSKMGLMLNDRKTVDIRAGESFTFLGFDIHGSDITLSRKWVKSFQREVDRCTILDSATIRRIRSSMRGRDAERAFLEVMRSVTRRLARRLFYGNGTFSWATEVLPTVNNRRDLLQLTTYCLDALRAVYTGKTGIGGLGKSAFAGITRGKGRNVRANREATRHIDIFENFLSMECGRRLIRDRWLYRAVTADMISSCFYPLYGASRATGHKQLSREKMIKNLEEIYGSYLTSRPDGDMQGRFYAYGLDDLDMEMLIGGGSRDEALRNLESDLDENVDFSLLADNDTDWYWQSSTYPQLVLLRKWFGN